jgi:branched-chain amino acid transport system substrate-binding protein
LENNTDAELVGETFAPLGNDDWSSQISDARESRADVAIATTAGADTVTWYQQASSAGLKDDMFIANSIVGLELANAVGAEVIEGTLGGANFWHGAPSAAEFTSDYRESYGRAPHWSAADAFASCMEIFDAVRRTGSTNADDIVDALEGNQFNWTGREQEWRPCDHKCLQQHNLVRGKAPDDMEDSEDYYEVLGGARSELSCEESNCDL